MWSSILWLHSRYLTLIAPAYICFERIQISFAIRIYDWIIIISSTETQTHKATGNRQSIIHFIQAERESHRQSSSKTLRTETEKVANWKTVLNKKLKKKELNIWSKSRRTSFNIDNSNKLIKHNKKLNWSKLCIKIQNQERKRKPKS